MLGTVASEVGEFRVRNETETLDLSSAKRIHEVWQQFFPTEEAAAPYVHKPKELARKVHGVGFQGNTDAEDGWIYRGRGLGWMEGRYEYETYGRALGIPLAEYPSLALNPVIGAHLAFLGYFGEDIKSRLTPFLGADKTNWEGAVTVVRRLPKKGRVGAKRKLRSRKRAFPFTLAS